jgi:hypothetical protein
MARRRRSAAAREEWSSESFYRRRVERRFTQVQSRHGHDMATGCGDVRAVGSQWRAAGGGHGLRASATWHRPWLVRTSPPWPIVPVVLASDLGSQPCLGVRIRRRTAAGLRVVPATSCLRARVPSAEIIQTSPV